VLFVSMVLLTCFELANKRFGSSSNNFMTDKLTSKWESPSLDPTGPGENWGRMESIDVWRVPQSFEPAHLHGYRLQVPSPDEHDSYASYLKQNIVADYAKGAEKVFLMIKTGGSVLWERLPIHMITTLTRFPNFALYSDAPGSIGGHEVIDILAHLSDSTLNSPEFSLYRHQRLLHDGHGSIGYNDDRTNSGWDLDKFKNLPMLKHAYSVSPDSDWFVFIDADTYVFADNLMAELQKMNPDDHKYMGSGSIMGVGYPFAHGGSGVILSRKTMQMGFGSFGSDIYKKYEDLTFEWCCGDMMVAVALHEQLGVDCDFHPGVQGRPYWGINYWESDWCTPLLTAHHMGPRDIEIMWEYEQAKRLQGAGPILYSDIYKDFVLPYIEEEMADWNNLLEQSWSLEQDRMDQILPSYEGGPEVRPYESLESCQKFCQDSPWCMAWRYPEGTYECYASDSFAMGLANYNWQKSVNHNMTSGYIIDRIRAVRDRSACDSSILSSGDKAEGWLRRLMKTHLH
jgi:hypothetical protein